MYCGPVNTHSGLIANPTTITHRKLPPPKLAVLCARCYGLIANLCHRLCWECSPPRLPIILVACYIILMYLKDLKSQHIVVSSYMYLSVCVHGLTKKQK